MVTACVCSEKREEEHFQEKNEVILSVSLMHPSTSSLVSWEDPCTAYKKQFPTWFSQPLWDIADSCLSLFHCLGIQENLHKIGLSQMMQS